MAWSYIAFGSDFGEMMPQRSRHLEALHRIREPSMALREVAAHALAAIHTAATLPYMAALLEDSNSNLRIEAIGGMGAFANGLPTQTLEAVPSLSYLQLPTSSPYQTADTIANFAMGKAIAARESVYLAFWKTWWSQQRTSLGFLE